ncbi:hypothetical protein [Tabrizicola aquatica]|uniref:hypothetical protein n=1 Tax=Tabrizicola aquatica TaxID=909926 RepID=UPI000CD299D5|nr:hypothetical protein [Tabrizicola aquatica]
MRAAALLLLSALPLQAQTVDPLPGFDLDSSITCLAYTANEIERNPDYAANRVEWMVFFSRLIAVKSTEADLAEFNSLFAQELAMLRNPMIDDGVPATPEEADEILTGTGKMCWFQALAAEGGPYEGQ